jgi:hypothetical protein
LLQLREVRGRIAEDLPANGQGPPTDRQLVWIGIEDPDVSGAWDLTPGYVSVPAPDLFSQLLATLPIEPWERTT